MHMSYHIKLNISIIIIFLQYHLIWCYSSNLHVSQIFLFFIIMKSYKKKLKIYLDKNAESSNSIHVYRRATANIVAKRYTLEITSMVMRAGPVHIFALLKIHKLLKFYHILHHLKMKHTGLAFFYLQNQLNHSFALTLFSHVFCYLLKTHYNMVWFLQEGSSCPWLIKVCTDDKIN